MRYLVCFYGLNRSLRWTAKGIRKNLLDPLLETGANVRCVAHFNEPATINAEHSNEFNMPVTRHGVDRLPLDYCLFEEQSETRLPKAALESMETVTTPRATMIALLSQLYSLKRAWKLSRLMPEDCDVYLFFRPDLEYIDRLDPEREFKEILAGNADLITPSWHQWGGLNDRLAFCSRKGAEAYANRINMVARHCEADGMMNGERLLSRVAQWSDLRLRYTNLRAMRVRASGSTIRERFDLNPIIVGRAMARPRIEKARALLRV